MSRIFNFLKKKDPIFRKIREKFGNVEIIQKIIQNYSVVSLVGFSSPRERLQLAAGLLLQQATRGPASRPELQVSHRMGLPLHEPFTAVCTRNMDIFRLHRQSCRSRKN
jgi:hypothetical protein